MNEDGTKNKPLVFEQTVKFMPHGTRQIEAMTKILKWKGAFPIIRPFIEAFRNLTVPVFENGPLADEFLSGQKMLQPLVFSHGLTSHKMNYSGLCREMASYGFLVVALNHNDRSCEYTTAQETSKINPATNQQTRAEITYNLDHTFTEFSLRHPQVLIREKEVRTLIDQILSKDFMAKTLGFNHAKIDASSLVVAGHSFGGITALGAACEDKRIAAVVSLDPWFFPHYKELNEGKFGIKQPQQASCLIATEGFYKYRTTTYAPCDSAYNQAEAFPKFIN